MPGPSVPQQRPSPHEHFASEHAASLVTVPGSVPASWGQMQQPQQHAASWGSDVSRPMHAVPPPVETATQGMSLPLRFWQPQAALPVTLNGDRAHAQVTSGWQVRAVDRQQLESAQWRFHA